MLLAVSAISWLEQLLFVLMMKGACIVLNQHAKLNI
jgi:hypothetical protein